MDESLQELNQKIDLLTTQVAYLSEQAQAVERQRLERQELVRDITPLATQAFNLAVEQLEEVQEYIDLNDLMRLLKRLLRNGRNLERMLDQLESLADLMATLQPLADEAFGKVVDVTAGLEAKGYFNLVQNGLPLMDKVVASLSPQDLKLLGESIAPIINILKEVSRPDVMNFANVTFNDVKQEIAIPLDASYSSLLRQLRDPGVRRGLALTLCVLRVIGNQAEKANGNHEETNKLPDGSLK